MDITEFVRGDKNPYLGKFKIEEYDLERDKIIRGSWQKNLITNKLKAALADVITGDYDANKHRIGKLAVGTGSTAVAATDLALTTQLGALKAYVPNSLHNDTYSNKAESTYYFDSTEAGYYGTWTELGLYAYNETDLLTHSLISPTKTFDNTKTMTVYYVIEF
jgi:hypothetical protein